VELIASLVAFFTLVTAWFVLPSAPPVREARTETMPEALPAAA